MELKIFNKKNDSQQDGELLSPHHQGDAGYDIIASSEPKIVGEIYQGYLYKSVSYIEYDTNISIKPSKDSYEDFEFFSLLFPRSSISKYNLSLCNSVGVIDSGYSDTIKIRFNYLPQPENYIVFDQSHLLLGVDQSKIYQKGDKISQLIFCEHIHPKIIAGIELESDGRGTGGFGSTGL